MMKFEVGKTYQTRSICDYDCIISVKIISRTEKTVKVAKSGMIKEGKTFRVAVWNGVETIQPWGRYSMSPMIRAGKEI